MLLNNLINRIDKRILRFLISGGFNSGVTYLLYLALSNIMHYQWAYLIAYVTGIVLAYVMNLRFVFKAKTSLKKAMSYPIIYIIQYLLGAGLMYLILSVIGLPNVIAPLLVIILLLPVSYWMNKKVLAN